MYGYPMAPPDPNKIVGLINNQPAGVPDYRALRIRPDSPYLQQWQNPQLSGAPVGYQGVPMGYGSPLAPGSSNAFGQAPAFDGTGYNFAGIPDPNRALRRIPDRALRRPPDYGIPGAPEYGY